MRLGSIRFRLTIWYLTILALGLGVFAVGNWFAMRNSAFHAIDDSLEDRIRGVLKFMQLQIASLSPLEIRDEFREHSVLGPGGDLFQVCDEQGRWLYRSAVLENSQIPIRLPGAASDQPIYENRLVQDTPVRFATQRVRVNGQLYTVQVAASLKEFNEALERFRLTLWLTGPLLLIAAGLGGYLISRRALRPVDQITIAAESISISNLSERLEVRNTSDELQRLSETLNRMLARLNASVQRISLFTADASHELRAPVTLIRTTAELAVKNSRTNEEYREDMLQILDEAERTSRLIDTLLFLARADAGGSELQHELTDISTCAREAVRQVHRFAAERTMSVELDLSTGPVVVHGDGEAIRRLCFILVENAIKYTPPGRAVQIRLKAENGDSVLTVGDSGIGIAQSDIPHIFDRFWRADKVRSPGTNGGAGLGLSIARWIVDQHHGSISVRSTLGQGSTFEVRIPLATTNAHLASNASG